MLSLSPIILFVYNRPVHTKKVVEALKENYLADKSELIIFSDGPKKNKDKNNVIEVREYIKKISGFKKIEIIESCENKGLARSIIEGVSSVIKDKGRVIVLEDDILTSKFFLKFMNDALSFYADNKKIWHICGWNYPILMDKNHDYYASRLMEPWGWATWNDRWESFEKNSKKLLREFSAEDIYRFDMDGTYNGWLQVRLNRVKYINTWAIYWYASIFKNDGLCINPTVSFVENIGLDGSGENCKDPFRTDNSELNNKPQIEFESVFEESEWAIAEVKMYFREVEKSAGVKAINKISRLIIGRNVI